MHKDHDDTSQWTPVTTQNEKVCMASTVPAHAPGSGTAPATAHRRAWGYTALSYRLVQWGPMANAEWVGSDD